MTHQTDEERLATLQRQHDEMAECLRHHNILDCVVAQRANRILKELGITPIERVGAAVHKK